MRQAVRLVVVVGLVISGVLGLSLLVNGYYLRLWKGFGRFTVIKIGEQIEVISVDPRSLLGTRLVVPGDVEIATLQERGQWRPKALVQLGQKYGWKWVGDSVADYLGIAYTGMWRELGVWDRLAWWNLARQADWQEVDLARANLLVVRESGDGEKVMGVADEWGTKARELFYAADMGESGVEVRIWNSTTQPGLAGKAAAALESAGLAVIQVGERATTAEECEVVWSGRGAKKAVVWVAMTLGCRQREVETMENLVEVFLGPGFAARYMIGAGRE